MIDARRCSPIHLRTSAQDREEFVSASHRIGIITPITYGSHGEIIDGILQANRWAKRMCIPIPYKTQSLDRSAIKMAAVQAIRDKVSLLVTIGPTTSLVVQQLLIENSYKIPQICVGAGDPVANGVRVGSLGVAKQQQCAAVGAPIYNMSDGLLLLRMLIPSLSRFILPVYHPHGEATPWSSFAISQVTACAQTLGVEVKVVKSEVLKSLAPLVAHEAQAGDVILMLEGDLLLQEHFTLAEFCLEKRVPCYAGAVSAVRSMALCGFAAPFKPIGQRILMAVQRILFDGVLASELTHEIVPLVRRPLINIDMAALLGVPLDTQAIRDLAPILIEQPRLRARAYPR